MSPMIPVNPDQPVYLVGINAREIYDAVIKLQAKVDVLIEQGSNSSREIVDHEGRLRTLERARWPLPAASVLIALISLAIAFFTSRH